MPRFFLALLISTAFSSHTYTAPCCSAGSASPTVITGDDKAQASLQFSGGYVADHQSVIAEVDTAASDITSSMEVSAAAIFADRWQGGFAIPFTHRRYELSGVSASEQGLGDLRGNISYEILPEWSYSIWRPKGFLFIQQVFPSGASVHESREFGQVDALGRGFFSNGLGVLFVKRWLQWDASALAQCQYSWARTFEGDYETTRVSPGFSGQMSLAAGFSPQAGDMRLGLRLSPTMNQGQKIETVAETRKGRIQMVWDLGFDVGWAFSQQFSSAIGYTDQTLLAFAARESNLSRTVALSFNYRWQR